MGDEGSVSRHIQDLKEGSSDAERAIFERYLTKLTNTALARMKGMVDTRPGALDPEMAAQSALLSVLERIRAHREERLLDRNDLLALLLSKLENKIKDQWRREHAEKRGLGMVKYAADVLTPAEAEAESDAFSKIARRDPTPEDVLGLQELFVRAMDVLPDNLCRHIAQLELDGYTDVEISRLTLRSLRAVQLKLRLIRAHWQEELG
jgi:DNA-directed RNA polymerase specialized sigma24 family protein